MGAMDDSSNSWCSTSVDTAAIPSHTAEDWLDALAELESNDDDAPVRDIHSVSSQRSRGGASRPAETARRIKTDLHTNSITSPRSGGSFSTTTTTTTARRARPRRRAMKGEQPPPRPSCGERLDGLRVRWIHDKLYGGRTVLGVSRTSRDGRLFVIIDDEGYFQLHGRTPFGWLEECKDEHPDPFAEELDRRADYFHCKRRSRPLEGSNLPPSHLFATGAYHTVVVSGDDDACYCLDHGRVVDQPPKLTRLVLPAATRIRAVAAGRESYLLLAESGQVYEGTFEDAAPRPVEALAQARCRAVACGEEHYLAATFDGVAYSWGRGADGRLGHNSERDVPRPRIIDGVERAVAVAGGADHSCVLCADAGGEEGAVVYFFGGNARGQLGTGDIEECLTPTRVDVGAVCVAMALGREFTLLINARGALLSCGCGARNGQNVGEDALIPRRIEALAGVTVVAVTCGAFHSMAASKRGAVYRWGGDPEALETYRWAGDPDARAKPFSAVPRQDVEFRVACGDCHVCRRADHLARTPVLLDEACRLQPRDEDPFWPWPDDEIIARVTNADPELDADAEIYDYPPQPCNLGMTAVHGPYVVEVHVVARGGRRDQVFFREEVRHLQWSVDKLDSKTLILTRNGVDDSFTFKERKRVGEWCRALEAWAAWSPL